MKQEINDMTPKINIENGLLVNILDYFQLRLNAPQPALNILIFTK